MLCIGALFRWCLRPFWGFRVQSSSLVTLDGQVTPGHGGGVPVCGEVRIPDLRAQGRTCPGEQWRGRSKIENRTVEVHRSWLWMAGSRPAMEWGEHFYKKAG